ncbi:MAG TPA: hypothetical protein VFZ48_01225 [Candidatus Saccharimonadales bacterium]
MSVFRDLSDPNGMVPPGTYAFSFVQSEQRVRRVGISEAPIIATSVKLHVWHSTITVEHPTFRVAVYEEALQVAQGELFKDTAPPPDSWDLHVFLPEP